MRALLVGDFAIHSGFARVNESLAHELQLLGWDIRVLAVNYAGDAHPLQLQYRMYPAWPGGDQLGVYRLAELADRERPDVILIVNDPWVIKQYLAAYDGDVPIVAYMPVDGTSLRPLHVVPLNRLACAIAYTQFGLDELTRAGLTCEARIIPHGIDRDLFYPLDQAELRSATGMDPDTYAVLILDHNQVRKRLDIAFDAFARFARDKPETVKLVYHGVLEAPQGWDIRAMAADLGITARMIYTAREITALRGVAREQLRVIYSMCDVKLSTTSGEGWGLTTKEAMACGLPCVLPRNSALAEWAADAALMVDCPIPMRHAGGINTVGCVPDAQEVARALDELYWYPHMRQELRERGLALVQQERYQWPVIARQFDHVLRAAAAEGARRRAQRPNIHTRPHTIDAWVVEQVMDKNEYGIGDLAPDDLIIDIGAHIGAFSALAYARGARRIEAYEPDSANAELLRRNVAPLGVTCCELAVWRSDVAYPCTVPFTGHDGSNTGAGNVVFGDGQQIPVSAVSLDSVIGERHVTVLKIDAESSEWPVLFTSRKLDRVDLIVGEYHEVGGPHDTNTMTDALRVGCAARYTASDLSAFLEAHGFTVSTVPYMLTTSGEPSNMGAFRAVKKQTEGVTA